MSFYIRTQRYSKNVMRRVISTAVMMMLMVAPLAVVSGAQSPGNVICPEKNMTDHNLTKKPRANSSERRWNRLQLRKKVRQLARRLSLPRLVRKVRYGPKQFGKRNLGEWEHIRRLRSGLGLVLFSSIAAALVVFIGSATDITGILHRDVVAILSIIYVAGRVDFQGRQKGRRFCDVQYFKQGNDFWPVGPATYSTCIFEHDDRYPTFKIDQTNIREILDRFAVIFRFANEWGRAPTELTSWGHMLKPMGKTNSKKSVLIWLHYVSDPPNQFRLLDTSIQNQTAEGLDQIKIQEIDEDEILHDENYVDRWRYDELVELWGFVLLAAAALLILSHFSPGLGLVGAGLVGAFSASPPSDDVRDHLRSALQDVGHDPDAAGFIDQMSDETVVWMLERLNLNSQVNEEAIEGVEKETADTIISELRVEVSRRHGMMVEGRCPRMTKREAYIHELIERLEIRDQLLSQADCPIPEERERRLDEAVRIIAKLTKESESGLSWDTFYNSVIVIGDPQMGKTATFLLFCILSIEFSVATNQDINMAVIICGRPKEPRTQTLDSARTLNRWAGKASIEVISDSMTDLRRSDIESYSRRVVRSWRNGLKPILVVKKDSKVLQATRMLLEREILLEYADSNFGGLHGLLIQDEADEAAVKQRRGKRMAKDDEGVHGHISAIRNALNGPTVGFTATENAVILMDVEASLFPKRLVMLTPGRMYVGPEYWLLQAPKCMMREANDIQQPLDATILRGWERPPESVCIFATDHVVATATRRLSSPNATSKALANVSSLKDVQEEFEIVLRRFLELLKTDLNHFVSTGRFNDPHVRRWFYSAVKQQFDRLKHHGIEVDALFGIEKDEQMEILAKASIDVIDATQPYILNEDSEDTWDDEMNDVIVIAGNKAGRAVVFKGLTSQYMPLEPITTVEDTNLQRLRCCGYRDPKLDLPYMCLTMKSSIRNVFVKIIRMRILKRTEMREIDSANLDLTVTEIPMHYPTSTSPTSLARMGSGVKVDDAKTSTTRVTRDRVPVSIRENVVTLDSKPNLWSNLAELLEILRINSKTQGICIPVELKRGIVFYGVNLAVLPEIANLCTDPSAEPYLEHMQRTHIDQNKSINIVFRVNPKGRDEDLLPAEIQDVMFKCGWSPDWPAYILRRSCCDSIEDLDRIIIDGCISPKELIQGYLPKGNQYEFEGHDHTLDGLGKNGSRVGVREEEDASILTFGPYKLVSGHAGSSDSEVLGLEPSVLFSARTSEEIALAQKAFINNSVREKAAECRRGLLNGGEEE